MTFLVRFNRAVLRGKTLVEYVVSKLFGRPARRLAGALIGGSTLWSAGFATPTQLTDITAFTFSGPICLKGTISTRCALSEAQLKKFKDLLFESVSHRFSPGPALESERSKIDGIKIEKTNQYHYSFSSSGTKFVIEKTVGTQDSRDPLAPIPATLVALFDGKDTYLVQSEGRSVEKYSGLNLSPCSLVPFVGVDYQSLSFISPYKESRFYQAFPPPKGLTPACAASLSEGSAYTPRPSTLKIVGIQGIPAVETVYLGTPGHAYETYSQSNPIVLGGHVIYKHSKWTEFVVDSKLNDLFARSIRETEVRDISTTVDANVFKLSAYAKPGAQIDENPNTPEEKRYIYSGENSLNEIPSSCSPRQTPSVASISSIVETLREAHSKHKKILLVFGASWCIGCNQLRKYIEVQDVAPILKKTLHRSAYFGKRTLGKRPCEHSRRGRANESVGTSRLGAPFVCLPRRYGASLGKLEVYERRRFELLSGLSNFRWRHSAFLEAIQDRRPDHQQYRTLEATEGSPSLDFDVDVAERNHTESLSLEVSLLHETWGSGP